MLHVELNRHLLYSWITLEAISYNCFHRSEGILKNFSIICRVCKPQYVAISGETSITYCIREMVHLILVFPRNDNKLYNLFGLAKKEIWKAVFYLFDHNRYLHLLFQQHLHLRNASIAKLLTLWPLLLFGTINPRTCSRFGVFLFLINLIFSGKWTTPTAKVSSNKL